MGTQRSTNFAVANPDDAKDADDDEHYEEEYQEFAKRHLKIICTRSGQSDARETNEMLQLYEAHKIDMEFARMARRFVRRLEDVTPFKRDWSQTVTRTENMVRVCQFNVLAHGLSGISSGFATLYDQGTAPVPKEFVKRNGDRTQYGEWLKKHLISAAERELMYSKTIDPNTPDSLKFKDEDFSEETPYPVPERMKRVVGLLLKQSPDIMTLQELDHFKHFSKVLGRYHYKGMFNKKHDPKFLCENYNGGHGTDGQAIFWNTLRFRQVGEKRVTLYDAPDREKKSGQGLFAVILQDIKNEQQVAVVTGHFKSGDGNIPIKKNHIKSLLQLLDGFKEMPIIFGCDFNRTSHSQIFQEFMQQVRKNGIHMKRSYPDEGDAFGCVKWRKGGDQAKKIENRHKQETIDFILQSGFTKKAILNLPKVETVLNATKGLGLPHWKYPSDHFMFAVDLELNNLRRQSGPGRDRAQSVPLRQGRDQAGSAPLRVPFMSALGGLELSRTRSKAVTRESGGSPRKLPSMTRQNSAGGASVHVAGSNQPPAVAPNHMPAPGTPQLHRQNSAGGAGVAHNQLEDLASNNLSRDDTDEKDQPAVHVVDETRKRAVTSNHNSELTTSSMLYKCKTCQRGNLKAAGPHTKKSSTDSAKECENISTDFSDGYELQSQAGQFRRRLASRRSENRPIHKLLEEIRRAEAEQA